MGCGEGGGGGFEPWNMSIEHKLKTSQDSRVGPQEKEWIPKKPTGYHHQYSLSPQVCTSFNGRTMVDVGYTKDWRLQEDLGCHSYCPSHTIGA